MRIKTIAVASAAGGRHYGQSEAAMRYFAGHLQQKPVFSYGITQASSRKQYKLARLFRQIHHATQYCASRQQPFLMVEGDHSSAMATWSGVMDALGKQSDLGLIWLDAHMDAHTFATSPSGNVHGMPLAALLGAADPRLAQLYPGRNYLKPENLILIGIRSYESGEKALLDRLGVEYHPLDSLKSPEALLRVLTQAVHRLHQRCDRIGLSIDLDVMDPRDAPAVATPVCNGLRRDPLLSALAQSFAQTNKLCGLEISEYVPCKDYDGRTLKLIDSLVKTLYASSENKFLGSFNTGIKAISVPTW